MRARRRVRVLARAALGLTVAAGPPPAAAAGERDIRMPAAEVAWARARAVPVGIEAEPVAPAERRAVLRLVGDARVVGLGEFTHGAHQPLAARNRWVRLLVAHAGFTAVTLESGLAQSRRVNDYVLGGPGDAAAVVREGLSWTFERYPANVALVRWLRGWNLAHPARTVRLYGADVSGGDSKDGLGHAAAVIDEVDAYLQRAAPADGAPLRARLRPFAGRFDPEAWRAMAPAERGRLRALVPDLRGFLDAHRSALAARTGQRAFAWARQMVEDIGRLAPIFDTWPPGEQSQHVPEIMEVVRLRDRAMADYVLWALAQEGPRGRVIAFAHNGHVTRHGFRYPIYPAGIAPPADMGEHLAHALGRRYRAVLTASIGVGAAGERAPLDRVLTAAGPTPYLLGLAASPPWWRREQDAGLGASSRIGVVPAAAADALLFVGATTDEPTTNALAGTGAPR